MLKNSIVVFCYAYICGIVLSMMAPIDGSYLPILWTATGLLFLGLIWAAQQVARVPEPDKPTTRSLVLLWTMTGIAPFVLGYTRDISNDTIPDRRVAVLEMQGGQAAFKTTPVFDDTCRLMVRKIEPLAEPLRFRLVGELRARYPVTSADGVPLMDAEGRWRFREVVVPQQSDTIEIGTNDAIGAEFVVEQPFNRVTRVEVLSAPPEARVEIYRVSNHASSFVRGGRDQVPVTILGRITLDPWAYDFKTVLTVTPAFLQYRNDGPYFKVDGGDIRITVDPTVTDYTNYMRSAAYGYDVVAHAQLSGASSRANPGGFDQQTYLNNYGVFGQMRVSQRPGEEPPIRIVSPEGKPPRRGNPMVEFSLALRDRMLWVIKLTLPYPVSAFMGGISLGMRYGLQSTECVYSPKSPSRGLELLVGKYAPCDSLIANEFKSSGVNHVLAVSGLHVTIITIMFVGIFTLMRVSKKAYVPIILVALIVFNIITGARPSTMRAVIMNSMFLLTWAYLGKNLRASALTSVPVAAFIILLQNPAVVVDPSFTLSFGAILALVLMTGPFYELLCTFRGNDVVMLFIVFVLLTTVTITHWYMLTFLRFWLLFALVVIGLFAFGRWLTRRGIKLIGERGFENIPVAIGGFIAAQGAIQMGMMVPLSPYYFCRWPVAGSFANLIAIPLVGIDLQLGMIACILGLIPIVGIYLALLLNAANWIACIGFMLIAHYTDRWFPYPFTHKPSISALIVYYILCALFIWWKPLLKLLQQYRVPPKPLGVLSAVGLVAALWYIAPLEPRTPEGLNITVLSVRYGSSILIESPGGRRILVDAGYVQHDRSRANEAERNILTSLASRGIRSLDGVIVTSPRPERSAGIAYILKHSHVNDYFAPPTLSELDPAMAFEPFCAQIGVSTTNSPYDLTMLQTIYNELIGDPTKARMPSLARQLAEGRDSFFNRLAGRVIRSHAIRAGDVLFEEVVDGKTFSIQVLAPTDAPPGDRALDNGALALRVSYGDFAMLIPSDLLFDGQQRLVELYEEPQLRANVIVVPARGTASPTLAESAFKDELMAALDGTTGALLDKAQPTYAIFEFGNPKPVLGMAAKPAIRAYEITQRYYSDRLGAENIFNTERDMAIFIRSDGKTCDVTTQAGITRASASDFDTVSDIEVGL